MDSKEQSKGEGSTPSAETGEKAVSGGRTPQLGSDEDALRQKSAGLTPNSPFAERISAEDPSKVFLFDFRFLIL
ncbi:unnamed protein product [Strongylus vulgaris]|uniref:Uncharacterized protein n=1 Tax=Strongylus vulgaris TaxID=40348 RepID=A0A3P7JDZ1_STRVU|nr:unnamed protein product [Strongylus vulgaris]